MRVPHPLRFRTKRAEKITQGQNVAPRPQGVDLTKNTKTQCPLRWVVLQQCSVLCSTLLKPRRRL